MRWIIAAWVFVVFVVLAVLLGPAFDTSRGDGSYADHLYSPVADYKETSVQSESGGDAASQSINASAALTIGTLSLRKPTDDMTSPPGAERISIGEPMDPNDESTLPVSTERISIGEPMDPNDESTLPVSTERISIGEPMDPNDESTLPVSTERISIGEPMDPNDESTLPVSTEHISIGEPMNVD